jgi:hypothetical protein
MHGALLDQQYLDDKVGFRAHGNTIPVSRGAELAAGTYRDPRRAEAGVSYGVRAMVISLLMSAVSSGVVHIPAKPSRLLLIRVYEGSERALLADSRRIATEAGMECQPKLTTRIRDVPRPAPPRRSRRCARI